MKIDYRMMADNIFVGLMLCLIIALFGVILVSLPVLVPLALVTWALGYGIKRLM